MLLLCANALREDGVRLWPWIALLQMVVVIPVGEKIAYEYREQEN